jgi:hypothetical protein
LKNLKLRFSCMSCFHSYFVLQNYCPTEKLLMRISLHKDWRDKFGYSMNIIMFIKLEMILNLKI